MRWDPAKSERLKRERGVSFEEIIQAEVIGEREHAKRAGQKLLLSRREEYVWVAPFVYDGKEIFLKTLYPRPEIRQNDEERGTFMKRFKLTKSEQAIERAIGRGEYVPVSAKESAEIMRQIEARRKDAVLNIRINSRDLDHLKRKARKHGVPYQTFIGEILHRYAH